MCSAIAAPILGIDQDSCTGTPSNCFSLDDVWSCIKVSGCEWYGALSVGSCRGAASPCSSLSSFERIFCEDQGCVFVKADPAPTPTPNIRGSNGSSYLSSEQKMKLALGVFFILVGFAFSICNIRRNKLAAAEEEARQRIQS